MRRQLCIISLLFMMIIALLGTPAFSDEGNLVEAPLSPKYLEWLAQHQSGDSRPRGHIPFPADLSHLAETPPDESLLYPRGRKMDSEIPATYDLRNVNGKNYVTSVKNQDPYGTCWAHSAIGSMESSFLRQGGSELDLSEMHLAYFTYINSDSSKAFTRLRSLSDILDEGGHSFFPVALFSRLDGPVLESDVPYPVTPSSTKPENYTRVLRLRDVYFLTFSETLNVNSSSTQRDIVKRRIMDNGAVVANYYDDDNDKYYNSSTGAYFYSSSNETTNHAILIVGWDDNYSRNNFATKPSIDGAWLIKNSWGENFGNSGYMWLSYANYLDEGSIFVSELANPDMKVYYYDALGWTGGLRGWEASNTYMANAFKAARTYEKLIEVGFYTAENNQNYEITVYTGLGTSMPSSPVAGTLALSQSGTIPFAGYHTITLNSPVALTQNQYFSVVVKYVNSSTVPTSSRVSGTSDNFSLKDGSFFSYNGTSWTKGSTFSANAPLKAFTLTSAEGSAPSIITSSLPSATINTSYTAMFSALGEKPIVWSISGDLPSSFELDASMGMITGTASVTGSYTFTVIASNDNGQDSKDLTLIVTDTPTITTTSLTGYVGYEFTGKLSLSNNASATWSITSELPKGIKFTPSTGSFSGKPKKAGTYSLSVKAETSAWTVSETVTLIINEKPVKAAIKTSSLTQVTIGDSVNETLKVSGTEPITMTIVEGMPDGLEFNASTYTFTGKPTVTGKFTIKISATNIFNTLTGKNPTVKKVKFFVKAIPPKIAAPSSLPYGIVGTAYSGYTVQLSSGSSPDKWSASGLPKGLSINTSGEITGTPRKAGSFKVKLKAKNNAGNYSTEKIPLRVYDTPIIKVNKLKNGKAGKAYSVKVATKYIPTSWDVTGLPSTLSYTMDAKDKIIITGTPSEAGSYSVVISLENPAGSSSKTLPLTIKSAKKSSAYISKNTTSDAYTRAILRENELLNELLTELQQYETQIESGITFGEERGVSELTQGERSVLEAGGYEIAAVLPVMSVDESGMYDLEAELDEDVETGRELVWLAFPRGEDESEDDEIAEFYDEDGLEIIGVPESHVVKLSVWLNEGVIYTPVIAVK